MPRVVVVSNAAPPGFIDDLYAAVGHAAVVTDPDLALRYRFDRAGTVVPGSPVAVVRPASTAEVASVVRVAAAHGIAIITRGAGTGLSGGSAARDGALTLSLDRMRSIHIDRESMLAVVQPGALNAEVKREAAANGLWYPPDPSSFEICSIGGNLATNAGGLCCVRYGVTTDYVAALEVVLADARVVRLGGRTVKDVAGLDLKRLFVGSEGALGVITEATLRLRPPPPPVATIAATFDDVSAAGSAVCAVVGALRPSALELMDAGAIRAVEAVRSVGLGDAEAVLLAQVRVEGDDRGTVVRAFEAAGATYVASTDDADEGELLMGARRMAIPCVERLGSVMIEDVGVPIPRIPDLLAAVRGISHRAGIAVPVIGHAGDGNFHPLVTFDAADRDAADRAQAVFDEIMRAALALGGTITGEHGVGRLKSHLLADQLGPDVMDLTRRIKAALDPNGLLNPGTWI
jgi:glycolate oxidase